MITSLVHPVVTPEDLHVFGEEVMTAFLLDGTPRSLPGPDGRRLCASIAVRGGWNGRVTLEVSAGGAADLARQMLQTDDVTAADVADAVGELVNVLGGNVKSLQEVESSLGLPEVRDDEHATVGSALTEICGAELHWAGHPVHVRVWLDGQTE